MRLELKVGLFVLIGLLSILFLTFQVKSLESFKDKGYPLYAIVGDASGLSKKSRVKMRGVKIGIVKDMELVKNGVKLKLLINNNVKIPINSSVTLSQDNVLGGKYLQIIPSNSNEYYKPNQIITKYVPTASMSDVMSNLNEAINKVKTLIDKVNNILDENTSNNIKITIANIKDSSMYLKSILKTTKEKLPIIINKTTHLIDNANELVNTYKTTGKIINKRLPSIMNRISTLTKNLDDISVMIKQKLPKLADEYIKLGKNANAILTDNKEGLKETITQAKNFFKNGSNSFAKLDKFLGNIDKSQINVDISSNYISRDDYFKTTTNIAYMPTPTKYYIIGVTSRDDYSDVTNADKKKSKIYFNAEIGKRFDNLLLRGGIIENTGGVGVDYFLYNDRIKLTADLYDFNSENDYRGDNPHLDLKARYLYLKHLEFIAGVDNVINPDIRSFFFGLGINFYDNDLKTLISGGATSFLK